MATEELISDLIERTRQNLNELEKLNLRPLAELSRRPGDNAWNALECIEHLNLYGDFYLPELERRVSESNASPDPVFKSGWLGDYFAKSMLPKAKLNKMKTFKDKNPIRAKLDKSVIDRHVSQQKRTLELLAKARQVNLTTTRTAISITPLLTLRLGDTLRVLIYHNQRHIVQALRAIGD